MVAAQLAVIAATSFDLTEVGLILAAAAAGATVMKLIPERRNLAVDSANMAVSAMKTSTDVLLGQLQLAETTIHELRDQIRAQDQQMQQLEAQLHAQIVKAVGLQAKLEELRKEYTSTPEPTA